MKETKHMSDIIYNVKNGKKNIIIKGRTGSGKTLLIHNLLPIIGRDCCVIEWIECINDINKLLCWTAIHKSKML